LRRARAGALEAGLAAPIRLAVEEVLDEAEDALDAGAAGAPAAAGAVAQEVAALVAAAQGPSPALPSRDDPRLRAARAALTGSPGRGL